MNTTNWTPLQKREFILTHFRDQLYDNRRGGDRFSVDFKKRRLKGRKSLAQEISDKSKGNITKGTAKRIVAEIKKVHPQELHAPVCVDERSHDPIDESESYEKDLLPDYNELSPRKFPFRFDESTKLALKPRKKKFEHLSDGDIALIYYASKGKLEVVQFLIALCENVHLDGEGGRLAFEAALDAGHRNIVNYILLSRAKCGGRLNDPILSGNQ